MRADGLAPSEVLLVGPEGSRMAVRIDRPTRETGSGSSDPPTVLLVHGFTGTSAVWDEAVRVFLEGYPVLRPDALGHGLSDVAPDPTEHALKRQTALLLEALDRTEAGKVHAVGYSMGGRLLVALAEAAPERLLSLTLEGASPGIVDPQARSARRAQDEVLARLLLAEGLPAFVQRWEDLPLFATQKRLPAAVQARQRELRLAQRPEGLAASLRGAGQGLEPPRWERLGTCPVPVLFVAGEEDARYRAVGQAVLEAVPDGRLATIPGCGHSPHLEDPAAFWATVLRFWAGAGARTGAGARAASPTQVPGPGIHPS